MSVIDTCRSAWNATKKSHQPDYDELIQSYRDMLSARAEAVLATGMTDDGPFAGFEQAVLNTPPEPAVSSDQGYEQVTDAEYPIVNDADQSVAAISGEPVETVEQVEKEHLDLKGSLPKDFPAHDKLHEAGINTYGQLNKVEDLTTVEGIGPATVKQIKKRLKADAKALNE